MLKSKLSLSRHFEYANKQITYHFWLCELCRSDFSISHGGLGDVTRHISTDKHKSNAKDVETSQSLSMFASGSSKRSIALSVIHAETLFQGFVTEHNLPLAINDHFF